jgi:hypothetical protein
LDKNFNILQNTKKCKMTQEEIKELKKLKLENIRDYHQKLIDNLEIPRSDFNMKMAFYDKQGRNVVGIFASEFKKEKGFYFELITRDLEPLDAERTVYKIPSNSSFEEEFELNEKGSYLVPLEELRIVNTTSVAISGASAISDKPSFKPPIAAYKAPGAMEDAPYTEMTIRDYYAIQTGKPVSSKTWLNDLIKSNK